MKISHHLFGQKSISLLAILFIINNTLLAQVDTTKTKTDTSKVIAVDTAKKTKAKEKKVKDHHIVYGGANLNMMDVLLTNSKQEQELVIM